MEGGYSMTTQTTEQEVTQKALTIVEAAKLVVIRDNSDYIAAGTLWKELQAMSKEIKETFDPLILIAHTMHKDTIAKRDQYLAPVEKATRAVKGMMSTYDAAQERIRDAEQTRLQELARKQEEEAQLQAAIAAEAAGQKAEADAILAEPIIAPTVIVQKATPKVAGGPVFRTIWKFRITDAGLLPREYLMADEVKIGQVVRALKGMTNIPGVQAYEERV
jgi:hypothetical protein